MAEQDDNPLADQAPAPPQITPVDEEAKKLHLLHTAQAWADERASSDAFDNNLLTFSSGALGLSVAFIKDIVPLESAEWLRTLYCSWAAFGGCIIVTVLSFQISAQAQREHTAVLNAYYLYKDESALKRQNIWSRLLPFCSISGSILLIIGIILTITFAANNVTHYKEAKAWQVITRTKK